MNIKNCNEIFNLYAANEKRIHSKMTYSSRTCYIKKYFLPKYGEVDPDLVSSIDTDCIYDLMKEKSLAHNTIYGFYMAMRSFYKYINLYGYGVNNPIDDGIHILPMKTN